jgi:hypothetical protein
MEFNHSKHDDIINTLDLKKFYNDIRYKEIITSEYIINYFKLNDYKKDNCVDIQILTEMIISECTSINNDYQWDWLFDDNNAKKMPDFKIIWLDT